MKIRYILIAILIFYVWTATQGSFRLDYKPNIYNYYNMLAESLLNGKLYLPIEPNLELLKLSDPYNPFQNDRFRLHDASLYKGKYYLYYGITPVVLLYIPYRLLFDTYMPDALAAIIFMFGAILWSSLLLVYLQKKYFKDIPNSILYLSIILVAFCNCAPYNLRCMAEYQISIACAYFFLTGGIYWLCTGFNDSKIKLWRIGLGSLFLGLSIGGRPFYILNAALLSFVFYKVKKDKLINDLKTFLILICSLSIPFLVVFILLGLYNMYRFDNFFDFGHNYVLTNIDYRKTGFFNIANVKANLYLYLLHNPIYKTEFPYSFFNLTLPEFFRYPRGFYYEKMIGLLPGTPFVLLIFLLPFVLKNCSSHRNSEKKLENKNVRFPLFEFLMMLVPGILNIIVLIFAVSTTMRFYMDYSTYFVLAACIVWFYAYDRYKDSKPALKKLLFISVFLASISILNGFAFGIDGCEGTCFQRFNPPEYVKLESIFKPVTHLLSRIFDF